MSWNIWFLQFFVCLFWLIVIYFYEITLDCIYNVRLLLFALLPHFFFRSNKIHWINIQHSFQMIKTGFATLRTNNYHWMLSHKWQWVFHTTLEELVCCFNSARKEWPFWGNWIQVFTGLYIFFIYFCKTKAARLSCKFETGLLFLLSRGFGLRTLPLMPLFLSLIHEHWPYLRKVRPAILYSFVTSWICHYGDHKVVLVHWPLWGRLVTISFFLQCGS